MVWCFSLESQRLTADTRLISAAKLKQQEHLDCYRARHRTGINNVIYFLTCFLPEIQMPMRWSLSLAGIHTTVEQDACFTINVLAKTGIRYTYSENIVLHRCCHSPSSSLSTPSFNRRETSAICFPLDEWSATVLPYIMPEWGRASSKTTSKTDFSDNCIEVQL